MTRRLTDAETAGIAGGALAAIAVAAVLGGVRGEVSAANASLVLVLVVLLAAFVGGARAGAATGLVAAVSFDFFLTRPYLSLAIKSTDDVVTTVLLVVTGLAVGVLASSRQRAIDAHRTGDEELASLRRVSGLIAAGAPVDAVTSRVEDEVRDVLDLGECRFERLPADPALPELDRNAHVDGPYVFDGEGFALPADGFAIPARVGERTLGWLVCRPAHPGRGISRDRRLTAAELVDHLAVALAAAEVAPPKRLHR